jgi:hypothetical protein
MAQFHSLENLRPNAIQLSTGNMEWGSEDLAFSVRPAIPNLGLLLSGDFQRISTYDRTQSSYY